MSLDWNLLLCALGLALIIEGLPHFLWPEKMSDFLRFLSERPPALLRKLGLLAIILGLVLVFLGRQP
jgi:uncharacterized protein YjeT (DUF2065 family)